jgi:hypothetical protein
VTVKRLGFLFFRLRGKKLDMNNTNNIEVTMMSERETIGSEVKKIFEAWVTPRLPNQEPERVGVPRGEPIGLSKKKFYAAQAQVLHFKSGLFTLADLAELSGVSPVQMRVWRTEKEFKKAAEEATRNFIEYLSEEALKSWHDEKKFHILLHCLAMQKHGIEPLFNKWNKEAGHIFNQIMTNQKDAINYNLLLDNMSFLALFLHTILELYSPAEKDKFKNILMLKFWPYIEKVFRFILEIVASNETTDDIKQIGKKILNAIALYNWASL